MSLVYKTTPVTSNSYEASKFIHFLLIQFKIWDSAGQERFKSLTSGYFRNADAAILVYSIDNEESFDGLHLWTRELDKCGKDNLVKVIVGNKSDLEENRVVSTQSAVAFAMADDASAALECSAKENDKIELLFEELARKLISMISGHFTSYLEGDRWGCRNHDPCKDRLVKSISVNNNGTEGKKSSFFSFPDLSSKCFRKICGMC